MSRSRLYSGWREAKATATNTGTNPVLTQLGFNNEGYTWNDQRVPITALEAIGVNAPNYAFFANNGEGPVTGQSAFFDSAAGTIPYDASIDLPASFSISFWINPEVQAGGSSRVIMDRDDHFRVRTTRNFKQVTLDVEGVGTLNTPNQTLVDGVWSFITCVCSVSGGDTQLTIYIDGTVQAQNTYVGSVPTTSDNDIVVGSSDVGILLDELAFFSAALDFAAVTSYYAGGTGVVLDGDEADLVSVYHFDGDALDDSTVNSNDMTFVGPVYDDGRVGGTGSVGVRLPAFAPDQRQELFFVLQLHHGVQRGTNLWPHFHWSTTEDLAGMGVIWGLEYTMASVGQVYGDTNIVECACTPSTAVARTHNVSELAEVSVADQNITESAMLLGRIFRNGIDDTFTGFAYLKEFDFHARVIKMGSPQEFLDPTE